MVGVLTVPGAKDWLRALGGGQGAARRPRHWGPSASRETTRCHPRQAQLLVEIEVLVQEVAHRGEERLAEQEAVESYHGSNDPDPVTLETAEGGRRGGVRGLRAPDVGGPTRGARVWGV